METQQLVSITSWQPPASLWPGWLPRQGLAHSTATWMCKDQGASIRHAPHLDPLLLSHHWGWVHLGPSLTTLLDFQRDTQQNLVHRTQQTPACAPPAQGAVSEAAHNQVTTVLPSVLPTFWVALQAPPGLCCQQTHRTPAHVPALQPEPHCHPSHTDTCGEPSGTALSPVACSHQDHYTRSGQHSSISSLQRRLNRKSAQLFSRQTGG